MGLKCKKGAIGPLHIIGAEPDGREGFIARPIEQHIVIGHVEMAIIVDPLILDPVDRAYERGREGHRLFRETC